MADIIEVLLIKKVSTFSILKQKTNLNGKWFCKNTTMAHTPTKHLAVIEKSERDNTHDFVGIITLVAYNQGRYWVVLEEDDCPENINYLHKEGWCSMIPHQVEFIEYIINKIDG